jgi:hypothetical protein
MDTLTQNKTAEETTLRMKNEKQLHQDENRIIPTEGEGIGNRSS